MEISHSRNGGNQSLLRCITSQPVNLVAVSFAHDSFARMTTDAEAGLAITYNVFDLPERISQGTTLKAKYTYMADGTKVSALDASGVGLVYRGPFTYRRSSDGTLTFESAPFDRGRLTEAGARYHVTDHLGSVRAVIDDNASTTTYPLAGFYSVDDFAPFGVKSASSASSYLSLASTGSTVSLRDGFTGQEDQGPDFGIGYSDFGARQYSPALSRWLVPDPMGEKYYDVSPYAYCAGNPVNLVDPDGSIIYLYGDSQAVNQYIEMLYQSTGNIYQINQDGQLSFIRSDDSFLQPKSKYLAKIIQSGIESEAEYSLSLVGEKQDDPNVFIDSYDSMQIDISDLSLIGKTSTAFQGAAIGHFLNEVQHEGPFEQAHAESLKAEGKIYGELIGDSSITSRKDYGMNDFQNGYQSVIYEYNSNNRFVLKQGAQSRSRVSGWIGSIPINIIEVVSNGRLKSVKRK